MARPRKANAIRDSRGKVRGESPEAVKAVVMAYRTRDVGPHHAGNPLAGFALGRLRLGKGASDQDPGSISERQFNAGERYAEIVRRHAAIMGYSLGSPKSPGFEMVAGGLSCRDEPDEETILTVRRQFSDCYRALMDAGVAVNRGTKVATDTYDICLDRKSWPDIDADVIGNLRVGLNALARVLK